jgi:hypothetical protein
MDKELSEIQVEMEKLAFKMQQEERYTGDTSGL